MSDYSVINNLPSKFIPYPENVTIYTRPLLYGEVMYMSEHKNKEIDLITKFADNEIIKCEGMEFWDLTLGDWMFLLLTCVAASHIRVGYNIKANCPICEGKVEKIDLNIPNSDPLEIKGELSRKVTPNEIHFKALDDDICMPIELDLSIGFANLDFYRMCHHRKKERKPSLDTIELVVTGVDVRKLDLEDIQIISYVKDRIEHGPEDEIDCQCPLCKEIHKVKVDWGAIDFLPFRPDEGSLRNRVSFGKRSKPVVSGSEETTIQTREEPVRQSNRTTGEDTSSGKTSSRKMMEGKPKFNPKE